MNLAKDDFSGGMSRLRAHFAEQKAGGNGKESTTDVRDTVEGTIEQFAKQVFDTRRGNTEDSRGVKLSPYDISLAEATGLFYGCDVPTFLKGVGVYVQNDSLLQVGQRFGIDTLNHVQVENLMIEHSQFSTAGTSGVNSDYRFIIPELIVNAIRTGYQHAALNSRWVGSVQNMSQMEITMPQIKTGDAVPSVIAEGAAIPVGSVQFGKKSAKVFKIGTGFSLTDELVLSSKLDMLGVFLEEVGSDMSIGADTLAIKVLISGEQADGSESAPVVGVDNVGTFSYRDLKRVFTRMNRLKNPATILVAGEEDTIDVTGLQQFAGYNGVTKDAAIRSIVGVPDTFAIDDYAMPDDQMLFLNPRRALAKLQFRGMITERRRNPQTQQEEMFISDWLNYAIVKRDARVILDKSVAYSGNGFPAYMDIDSRIKEAYKQF